MGGKLKLVTEPGEFFKDQLLRAAKRRQLRLNDQVEFYLVNLLREFMYASRFHEEGKGSQTLAELLAKALDTDLTHTAGEKQKFLKRLGDVSLYTAGFFSESLKRRLVGSAYYVSMGMKAYSSLAVLMGDPDFRRLFSELATRFPVLVEVMTDVSVSLGTSERAKDILRLYETWLKTQNEVVAEHLTEAGIDLEKSTESTVAVKGSKRIV